MSLFYCFSNSKMVFFVATTNAVIVINPNPNLKKSISLIKTTHPTQQPTDQFVRNNWCQYGNLSLIREGCIITVMTR